MVSGGYLRVIRRGGSWTRASTRLWSKFDFQLYFKRRNGVVLYFNSFCQRFCPRKRSEITTKEHTTRIKAYMIFQTTNSQSVANFFQIHSAVLAWLNYKQSNILFRRNGRYHFFTSQKWDNFCVVYSGIVSDKRDFAAYHLGTF